MSSLEENSDNAKLRRTLVEGERVAAEAVWQAEMDDARSKYETSFRVQWLSHQLVDLREAKDALGFVTNARRQLAFPDEDRKWLDWVEHYANEIDPLQKSLAPPQTPEPRTEDLVPFLKVHSPIRPLNE